MQWAIEDRAGDNRTKQGITTQHTAILRACERKQTNYYGTWIPMTALTVIYRLEHETIGHEITIQVTK